MQKRLNRSLKFILAFGAILVAFAATGCSDDGGGGLGDTLIYTVIYDGNGGFLGNKTYTVRKLKVAENSKIPKYLSEYADDPYVVSSLGLATRDGYNLQGWYLPESAHYEENASGNYVYLDMEDGNGVYSLAAEGAYVYGFVEAADGTLIYIDVEDIPEEVDPTTVEYIYYQGTNGWGFYIYNSDDADMVPVYETDGSYTVAEVAKFSGASYLEYSSLTEDEKTLFSEIKRYNRDYYLYTEADEGLDRYDFESGYATYDSMIEENDEGAYVVLNDALVLFDSENPEHADLQRYSLRSKYVFTPTATVLTPTDLTRYEATLTYWDFETDRVTHDITLVADWTKKCTVNFIQKSGQVTTVTTKLNEEKTNTVDLAAGETIGKIESIPLYAGYTFVGWSTSETEYLPWDFDNDLFPYDTDTLNLYAYMVAGEYTRITNASQLLRVVNNLSGSYLLCNDIDLGGAVFTNSTPAGFLIKSNVGEVTQQIFTGTFLSMGYTISNFTLRVRNSQKEINQDAGVVVYTGLFPFVKDAHIEGLSLEDVTVLIETSTTAANVICELGGAGLVGTALDGAEGGKTVIKDCSVDVTFVALDSTVLDVDVRIGDIAAVGSAYLDITGCSGTIDYAAIAGITTANLLVNTLD